MKTAAFVSTTLNTKKRERKLCLSYKIAYSLNWPLRARPSEVAARLVHVQIAVDLSHEPEAGEEADRTGQQEEQENHDEGVAEVEDHRREAGQRFGHEVVHAADEQVERGEAGREERSPPPIIILGAQVEIAEQYGGLRAGDDQDDEDEKQKTEHVVELITPDRVQNKEQLNKNAAERQYTAHHDARQWLSVDRLGRYLSWNLVGAYRILDDALLEAKVGAHKGERQRDAKPEEQQSDQGGERNGG